MHDAGVMQRGSNECNAVWRQRIGRVEISGGTLATRTRPTR